jgi:hypothetical protein
MPTTSRRLATLLAPALALAACTAALAAALPAPAQMQMPTRQASPLTQPGDPSKPIMSPPADADVTLAGKSVMIHYNSPLMRGRKIMGDVVPYGKVWRTGANPATDFKTDTALKIGNATVPAGHYTLYTLPSEGTWQLIVNKQTGQWGTKYDQSQDLVRIPMHKDALPAPQDKMSISFTHTHGTQTQLHIRWETTDVWVPVSAQ